MNPTTDELIKVAKHLANIMVTQGRPKYQNLQLKDQSYYMVLKQYNSLHLLKEEIAKIKEVLK